MLEESRSKSNERSSEYGNEAIQQSSETKQEPLQAHSQREETGTHQAFESMWGARSHLYNRLEVTRLLPDVFGCRCQGVTL